MGLVVLLDWRTQLRSSREHSHWIYLPLNSPYDILLLQKAVYKVCKEANMNICDEKELVGYEQLVPDL